MTSFDVDKIADQVHLSLESVHVFDDEVRHVLSAKVVRNCVIKLR